MENINIKVDANMRKPFKHFYDAVGYANADYTYTEPSKRMYDYLSSFNNHFKYMRLHNILTVHGKGDYYLENENQDYGNPNLFDAKVDTVVTLDENGNLIYNWTVVDKIYDIFMLHKIKPIVETVFIPSCLQLSKEEDYLPRDFNLWAQLLTAFVTHLQQRYGKEEVESWYFEVWNEPDNHKEWVENPESFFALYDYMENAIHEVNTNIKVGGPATKQWDSAYKIFEPFLQHCSKGLNYATGKFGTRVDFISVHCKGGYPDSYCPSVEVMFEALKKYMDIIKKYPEYKDTEFFNDESDIVWKGHQGIYKESWLNFRNTHYAPGFTCKMVDTYCNVVEDEYGMNLSIVDSDNCHIHWERYLFSGNRSQFTPLVKRGSCDLIKKPINNSYVLLSRLGKERLHTECCDNDFKRKFGLLPTIENSTISMMLWNFEDGMEQNVNTRTLKLDINNIPFRGKYKLIHYRIDKEHSSSYTSWEKLGKPENPTVDEIKVLREKEGLELYEAVKDINLKSSMSFEYPMPMHSVSLLLLVPYNEEKPEKPQWIKAVDEKGFNDNAQVFLKWEPDGSLDFLYYKIWRREQTEKEFTLISDNTSINTAVYMDMDVQADSKYIYKIQSINASMVDSECSDELIVTVHK